MAGDVGKRIKKCRLSRGLSQEELASAVDTSKQNIYKYESGIITNIPMDRVERIARVLDTTPAYLMGWEEPAPSPEPEIQLMSRAMYAMTPEERAKLIEIGKVMFREAFRDDQKP